MNWATIRAKLLDTISRASGVETIWRDRERSFVTPSDVTGKERGVQCLLQTFGASSHRSDIRSTYNSGTGLIDLKQCEQGRFTLQCLVESTEQADTRQAMEYTERIRSAMNRPQVLAFLREAEITCSAIGDSVDLPADVDDHVTSRASVDLTILFASNTENAFGLDSIGWIESVEGTRDPLTPDVPAPINGDLNE